MLSQLILLLEDPSDEPLLIELYKSYRDKACAVAMYFLHNTFDAEDAAMDTWTWIATHFSTAKKSHTEARFEGLLITTVKHIAIDKQRKNNKGQVSLEEWDAPTPDISAESVEAKDEAEAVIKLMCDVPAKDRVVLEMRKVRECSFAQIGKVLKSSEDAARMRFNRAVEELRMQMEKAGY